MMVDVSPRRLTGRRTEKKLQVVLVADKHRRSFYRNAVLG